ncbi:polyribonucleotide nucleotidyltransferase [Kallotenue papyrolyticum]|uniref:polyribonucleotide nucleotidyltransferase n=1 Tax=Kallotenue papyrolyticum TaxID=1325125 RepID=UPI000478529F|nr:polyribonucleotide nucleotidyltransferase [Kallotenue papyrolyticum]
MTQVDTAEQNVVRVSTEISGRTLTLETGRMAQLANGAVLARYGDTVLLATVVASEEPREGIDFFPLTVDYEERMYSAGKIPGSFFKREGRPTETAILTARLTDRPLRPLFPKGFFNDVQVIITTLATDRVNDPGPLAIVAASAALHISDIPFNGPVGAVLVGHINDAFVINPEMPRMNASRLDLVVAGTREAVLMVEAGAHELTEDEMLQAVIEGHAMCKQLCDLQDELRALAGKPKRPFTPPQPDTSLEEAITAWMGERLRAAINNPDKQARQEATAQLKNEVLAHFTQDVPEEERAAREKAVAKTFEALLKEEVRSAILERDLRVDGRGLKDIRPVSVEVGVLPQVHGSGLFTRGQTQVLTVVTLGAPGEEQRLDDLGLETTKRYIHHYNFPPFSTGEVRPLRGPRRRDIGHGHLAERALYAVLPDETEFPYTMRLVSEVLSSNGSSSMASVCGSSLALMDAGVPITKPVAGVAMGLITGKEPGQFKVLTDIQGIEDALGDMDFKVAGTADGVTALQMDIKTTGITYEIMRQAFQQAREGRLQILEKMNAVISAPRPKLAPTAPRIITLQINPEKIGIVIGPGGKTIRSIIEESGAQIDIQDDGTVFITTPDERGAEIAQRRIEDLTREIKEGEIFVGKVVSIKPFGAFVNLVPGRDGMLHVSEIAEGRVTNVEDVLKVGDEVRVKVIDIDPGTGKVSLSRRAVLTGETPEERKAAGAAPRSRERGPERGGERGGFRGGDRERGGSDRERRGPLGPRNPRRG